MIIKLQKTTKEYKRGFRDAMIMIEKMCNQDCYKEIEELGSILKAGLMLDDLVNKEEIENV